MAFLNQFMSKMFALPEKLFCASIFMTTLLLVIAEDTSKLAKPPKNSG